MLPVSAAYFFEGTSMEIDWSASYTREDLRALSDVLTRQNEKLIQDNLFLEKEMQAIIEAARRAFPLRHTDNGVGLRQLIHAVREMKARCEARALEVQMKRTEEGMQEIETFRERPNEEPRRTVCSTRQGNATESQP